MIFEHCAPCHRPGQGTPFSLLTYEDVRRRATRIDRAIASGHMPPWLPAPQARTFVGARRLAEVDRSLLRRWIAAGTPEGPRAALPSAPAFPDGWRLGQPDLVVETTAPYHLAPGGDDVFRNLLLRVPISSRRQVRALEFDAGGAPVHHAIVHIDRTTASRRRDGADGQPGFEGMGGRDAQDPDGHFLGWAPGRGPIVMPDGMPWPIDPGTDLVVELHLVPGDTRLAVAPRVALYFTDQPATATPVMFKMGSKAIDIPAGEANYVVEERFTLPVDLDLISLYPHAHYLGREMRVEVEPPSGGRETLLHIPRWNFRWQQDYRFESPVPLRKGTTVYMRFTYDNSSANGDNPHRPPRQVLCGQQATDEMGNLGLQVVPRSAADRHTLLAAARRYDVQANLAGAQMLVRNNAGNAENQIFLAGSYVEAGRPADALPHLDLATRLDPRSANAYNELGGALLALGRTADALAAFERAVALAPDDDRMHFNVASVRMQLGRRADAATAFERAIALNPASADAHGEFGALLFGVGRTREALAHLERAVALSPDIARLQSDLGGVLAALGRYPDALAHVRRALELDPSYGPARDNLMRLSQLGFK